MVETLAFVPERMREAAAAGCSTATDLADWLVREAGVPFREAHHIVGLADLSLEDFTTIDGRIGAGVYDVLTIDAPVASRTSFGGTAPAQVRARIAEARHALGMEP